MQKSFLILQILLIGTLSMPFGSAYAASDLLCGPKCHESKSTCQVNCWNNRPNDFTCLNKCDDKFSTCIVNCH
jgi:hypothetical protein